MRRLLKLLSQAKHHLLTKEEIDAINGNQEFANIWHDLQVRADKLPSYDEISIGEYYSRQAHYHWNNEKNESIEVISDYIVTGEAICPSTIIGFIAAWTNSEIQHPIVEKLVKHTLKNNLLKLPLNTTVSDYLAFINKKPNHAPIKDPIESLEVLMFYFKIKSVNGVYNKLKMPRATIKDHLDKLVGKGYDYKILIDQNFEHYKKIEIIYKKWINQSSHQ
jgi:uncharacterized protein (UPF0305 family)